MILDHSPQLLRGLLAPPYPPYSSSPSPHLEALGSLPTTKPHRRMHLSLGRIPPAPIGHTCIQKYRANSLTATIEALPRDTVR